MSNLIIFKTHSFPNVSETFIVSNIIETIKRGFNVKIIVDTIKTKADTSQIELLEQYDLMNKVSKMDHPVTKRLRNKKTIYLLGKPVLFYYFIKYILYKKKKSLDYIFTLHYYLNYRKAKVFHVHFATAINPLFELKKIGFLKSKIIITFHGHDAHFLPEGRQLVDLINDFNEYVEYITVNSLYIKNKLVKKGFTAENIKIISIGVDTLFFSNNIVDKIENKSFNIITVGRLIELKGQSFGIKSVKLLVDKGYKINYTLVGIGDELEQLKKIVVELNLEDSVHFYGIASQTEIKELLRQNDLFLMTSTSDIYGRCEAFGVVSLEAQAMGLPVVGFKSGGFVETIIEGKTGVTVEDKDCIAMANQIEFLINNNEIRRIMGKAAKKNIKENFDTSIVTAKYLELYS